VQEQNDRPLTLAGVVERHVDLVSDRLVAEWHGAVEKAGLLLRRQVTSGKEREDQQETLQLSHCSVPPMLRSR
jgi:hypothetical protein